MRQIAHYEKVEGVDIERVKEDLSVVPQLEEVAFGIDTFLIKLGWIDGKVLSFPSMGGYVANNDYSVLEMVDKYRSLHLRKPLGNFARVLWGSHSHFGSKHDYYVELSVNIFDYCEANEIPIKVVEDESKFPPLEPRGSNLFCKLGWHTWEKEPVRDYVKHSGIDFLFSSSGVQKAIRRCVCCGKRKKVYRRGWIGFGGPLSPAESTGWKTLTPEIEKEIDALARM